MTRGEWLESLLPIVVILMFWPLIFLGWFPLWYQIVLYVFAAAALTWSIWRRVKRHREDLRYAKQIMESQKLGMPPGYPPSLPGEEKREPKQK